MSNSTGFVATRYRTLSFIIHLSHGPPFVLPFLCAKNLTTLLFKNEVRQNDQILKDKKQYNN